MATVELVGVVTTVGAKMTHRARTDGHVLLGTHCGIHRPQVRDMAPGERLPYCYRCFPTPPAFALSLPREFGR